MAETRKCWNNRFATLALYSYRVLVLPRPIYKKSLYLNKAGFLKLYSNKGSFYEGVGEHRQVTQRKRGEE